MMDEDRMWHDCGEEVEFTLDMHTRMRFMFRTMNLFGITGPEHHIEIASEPESH